MWPNPQETADFVSFTEETLNGKLLFCAVRYIDSKNIRTTTTNTTNKNSTANGASTRNSTSSTKTKSQKMRLLTLFEILSTKTFKK